MYTHVSCVSLCINCHKNPTVRIVEREGGGFYLAIICLYCVEEGLHEKYGSLTSQSKKSILSLVERWNTHNATIRNFKLRKKREIDSEKMGFGITY